jgi:phosphate transport system protein
MREHYIKLLQEVRDDVVRMGNRVEYRFELVAQALHGWNTTAAQELVASDQEIDAAQILINEKVLRVIATQNPIATDLRVLMSVTAVTSELERIGDYCRGIGKSVLRAVRSPRLIDVPSAIHQMVERDQQMLNTALESFVKLDENLARSLAALEQQVDVLDRQVKRDVNAAMKADNEAIDCGIELIKINYNLERSADRTTNIGEGVIFISTTEVIDLNT